MMPMLVSEQQKKTNKVKNRSKLRHLEYYGLQEIFDKLYAESKNGKIFNNLMEIIKSEENIKLAYRNIKKNTSSKTSGTDGLTIKTIEKMSESDYLKTVMNKMSWYKPKTVSRVEIPKPTGKLRPLGIPTIWDRIVQQCILQVLEPICEAKFNKHSYGFRPNRSTEHAIADAERMIQIVNLHYVVDMDIKSFFDNVDHAKLAKQMWELGIRDKTLICIIKAMLKAPVQLPSGELQHPIKGTPQGGVLSPLLANIVLNELDWWITSQWETMPTVKEYSGKIHSNGTKNRGHTYRALRNTSKLKEMYIVRYADDFKIFCRKRSEANKIFIAVKHWLKDRLKLEVSEEKSKVVNLKKNYSEFLGLKLKVVKKCKKYVIKSHMCEKAIEKVKKNLIEQVKKIQRSRNAREEWYSVTKYNSMVIGIHNYYKMATNVNLDMNSVAFNVKTVIAKRLRKKVKRKGSLENYDYIRKNYGKSKETRYINKTPLIPVGYVQTKPPINLKRKVNSYTPEGRMEINKKLGVNTQILRALMREHSQSRSIEYMDNRISLYAGQNGRCAITKKILELGNMQCHHKKPMEFGGTDEYSNLVMLHTDVHILIHAKDVETIEEYVSRIKPDKNQLTIINKFRILANNSKI